MKMVLLMILSGAIILSLINSCAGATWPVSNLTELYTRVSQLSAKNGDPEGEGGTVRLSMGNYKCSDGTCTDGVNMLPIKEFRGEIRCEAYRAGCILNGESSRRIMAVDGTATHALKLQSLKFYKGKADKGAGLYVHGEKTEIIIEMCVFGSNEATGSGSDFGGGGIMLDATPLGGSKYNVKLVSTSFTGNTAESSGNGDDIYSKSGDAAILDNPCPWPFQKKSPVKGKKENALKKHFDAVVVSVRTVSPAFSSSPSLSFVTSSA